MHTVEIDSNNLSGKKIGNDEGQIIVKFMHRGFRRGVPVDYFLRLFPQYSPSWGNCKFVFDVDCDEYDWLVVYHDIPALNGSLGEEKLKCSRDKTILVTLEPVTITVYGRDYLRQFGHILTFQEPWAVHHHPGAIYHHPGLLWFYGVSSTSKMTYEQIAQKTSFNKENVISTVCSQRTGGTTLHSARVEFTRKLKEELPELEVFGHGVRPMDDKAEALDSYKYHIAVENHVALHHLTEKLPDAFLGCTLPFYHGAPNASDYFPKESFVSVDISNYKKTKEIIQSTIANNEYEDRLPYILQARKIVLEEQNLFAILAKQIESRDKGITGGIDGTVIRNRFALRLKNPLVGIRNLAEKVAVKAYLRVTAGRRQ